MYTNKSRHSEDINWMYKKSILSVFHSGKKKTEVEPPADRVSNFPLFDYELVTFSALLSERTGIMEDSRFVKSYENLNDI